jgi:hypothetical protein
MIGVAAESAPRDTNLNYIKLWRANRLVSTEVHYRRCADIGVGVYELSELGHPSIVLVGPTQAEMGGRWYRQIYEQPLPPL